MQDRFILPAPAARASLINGMDLMIRVLRPTLGPVAGTVALTSTIAGKPPEILDNAALIAKRTEQIAHPFENMGAMLVRHMTTVVQEQAGDGAATAAVLTHKLIHSAATYIAAGYDPVRISRGLEKGLDIAQDALRHQAREIDLPSEIAKVVAATTHDPKLATMIGEIMDSVGPDGAVLLEDVHHGETHHKYIAGVRWTEGYSSPFTLRDGQTTANLINPRIFVTDYPLKGPEQLLPIVERCVEAGERSLLVIAPDIGDAALSLLIVNREKGVLDDAVAVRAPGLGAQQNQIVQDIAVITGGRFLRRDAYDELARVTIEDLGKARRAWATRSTFGIIGGQGSKAAVLQRLAEARAELRTTRDDSYVREKIQERIAKLAGMSVVVYVGMPVNGRQQELRATIEAGVSTARSALREGVVAGGGAAFVACLPALEAMHCGDDEMIGVKILAEALGEPMRAICENAGVESGIIVQEALDRGPDWMYDVLRREWVGAFEAGIVDPLTVTTTALRTSVSIAKTAMTTDVLIRHKKNPATPTTA